MDIPDDTPEIQGWQRWALGVTGFYGRDSTLIRRANKIYETCSERARSPELAAGEALNHCNAYGV